MIKRLQAVALDCADPVRLAEFYAELLGGRVVMEPDEPDWVEWLSSKGRSSPSNEWTATGRRAGLGRSTPNRSTSTSTWTTLSRTRNGCSSLAGPCSSALTSCARTPTGGSTPVLAKGSQRPTLASHRQSQDARHRLEQLSRSPSPNLTSQPRNTRNPSMRLHQ